MLPGDRDPRRFAPVFVLSPARSCSSLVVTMLGRHPALYGFPELRLFRVNVVGDLLGDPPTGAGTSARQYAAGLLRSLAQLHEGRQDAAAIDRAWAWLGARADLSCIAVMDHLLAAVEPRAAVEKSPETSRSVVALRRVATAYPAARFVHLVRHPWSTVASMVRAWSGLDYWPVPPDRAATHCAEVWLDYHRRLLALSEHVGSERMIRLRAEDVANRPADSLPLVCRWLGVDDGPQAIAAMLHPEESPYAVAGPPNAEGGLDAGFLRQPGVRAVQLPPRSAEPAGQVEPVLRAQVAELGALLGYDLAPASARTGVRPHGLASGRR